MKHFCFSCSAVSDERIEFCPACGRFGSYVPVVVRGIDTLIADEKILTIRQLRSRSASYLELKNFEWLKVPKIFSLMIYGLPGSGKSSFLLKLAESLSGYGKVFFNSLEEGFGESLIEKLRRLEIVSEDIFIGCINNLQILLEKIRGYDFVIFDSLTSGSLNAIDVARVMRELDVSVLFSVHSTKEGDYTGKSDLGHYTDILLRAENMQVSVEKSRFFEIGGCHGF